MRHRATLMATAVAVAALAASPAAADTGYSSLFTVDLRTLHVVGLEVTQGVQDLRNSVVLVRDRPTSVRVHVRSSVDLMAGVEGQLRVSRGGTVVATLSAAPVNVQENPMRTSSADSFRFDLPASEIRGELELELLSQRTLACEEPAGAPGGADTTPAGDCKVRVRFEVTPALRAVFVPFKWSDWLNDHVAGSADVDAARAELLQTMPLARVEVVRTSQVVDVQLAGVLTTPDSTLDFALLSGFMENLRWLDGCWDSCTDYYFGILADGGPGTVGMAGGIPSFVFAGYNDNDRTVAHEVGHCLGRSHTNYNCQRSRKPVENGECLLGRCVCCVWPLSCSAHTPADGTIGGGNLGSWQSLLLPDTVFGWADGTILPPWTPDLMGYGNGSWPSKYTYTGIREHLVASAAAAAAARESLAPATPALLVSGIVDLEAGTGQLRTVQRLDGPLAAVATGSPWALRVEDGDGATLGSYPFEPPVPAEGTVISFSVLVAWHPTAARVVLLHGGGILDQRLASAHAPTVQLTFPNGGETLGSSGTLHVTWTAGDLDGGALTFDLQYSRDAGSSWQTLAMDVSGTALDLDLARLPGSPQGTLRVIANDGFHTATDASDATFTVAGHPPAARILAPAAPVQILTTQSLNLWGEGFDEEDGQLGDAALTWSSTLAGALGSGAGLAVSGTTLGVGTHTVTLTATDGQGASGTATVVVTVAGALPAVPVTLDVAPDRLPFTALEHQGALTGPETVAVRNRGAGAMPWTASADHPWIVLGAASGDDQANLDVQVNAATLEAGEHTGTVTVTAAGAESSPQTIAVTASVVPFVATAAGAPLGGLVPLTVAFEGGALGASPPLTYSWSFGDSDATSVAASPSHVYTEVGAYPVTLDVTDGSGRTRAATPLVVTAAAALKGDANGDGTVNVADVFYLINHLFASGPDPIGPANVNGDETLNVGDVFYLINHLFAGGPAPV